MVFFNDVLKLWSVLPNVLDLSEYKTTLLFSPDILMLMSLSNVQYVTTYIHEDNLREIATDTPHLILYCPPIITLSYVAGLHPAFFLFLYAALSMSV